jgi:indolepyruvate ferredoxin oxidoreductase beta subunit
MNAIPLAIDRPIGIAIVAMGGQGGGVLADWIVAMAEANGWTAQSTSVPGVAQRTGATIYYVEIIKPRPGRTPVLSLMPMPGDVDVVIAAELMEAGRAIQRGLVSPGRTTLIASSHRSLSMEEKIRPGDGTADSQPVLDAASSLSRRFVCADMQAMAERGGSVISAALFGALAASDALPFPRAAYEDTIRAAGVGVGGSLKAFSLAHDEVMSPAAAFVAPAPAVTVPRGGSAGQRAALAAVLARIDDFPSAAREMLRLGVARLVDFQDIAYAEEYLGRIARLPARLAPEAAKQIAVAMSYDDVIRVADLKTRASRIARVRAETAASLDQLVDTTEFMHPRVAEMCATMPVRMGLLFERSRLLSGVLRLFERGRRVRTTTLAGYLPLYLIAGLRSRRRSLLRHQREQVHLEEWLGLVERYAMDKPDLALELLKCRRLVKGYSDTHARGSSKFDRVLGATALVAHRDDAAAWIRRLRDAALADADGAMLDGAIATVRTL